MSSEILYYPGCSLESTGKEFDLSSRAVCAALGLKLTEIDDWSCCGATSAHNMDQLLSLALPARNLALAQETGLDIAVPCAACYSRLKTADHVLRNNQELRGEIESVTGFTFKGQSNVLSMLEAMVSIVGLDAIKQKVVKHLNELPVVCYYGCLLVRPPEVTRFDRAEYPQVMDRLVEALGAKPLTWSYKTECCGASLSLTNAGMVEKLVGRITKAAKEAGASAIITACPLCQSNLEMRQPRGEQAIPSLYFTELMGLAMGLAEARSWLGKHLVSPEQVLQQIGS